MAVKQRYPAFIIHKPDGRAQPTPALRCETLTGPILLDMAVTVLGVWLTSK